MRVGPFLTEKSPLKFKVKPNSQGVFHLVKVDPAVDTPKFLGSLPISGSFGIDLTYHASQVNIGLGLPSPFTFGAKRDASGTVDASSPTTSTGCTTTGCDHRSPTSSWARSSSRG